MSYSLHNLPQISSRIIMKSGQNKPHHHGFGCIAGLCQDYFMSWPSIMQYMDMNEAYKCLDGIRGTGSCLLRPTSTPTWHQIGLFDYGK